MRLSAALVLVSVLAGNGFAAASDPVATNLPPDVQLDISPRICTLTGKQTRCETPVHAKWRASHSESLCLVIVSRPDVKHCWEHYSEGTYTMVLTFAEDLTFELRDASMNQVLASQALRVIREAIAYRHRRRQPWNIFD